MPFPPLKMTSRATTVRTGRCESLPHSLGFRPRRPVSHAEAGQVQDRHLSPFPPLRRVVREVVMRTRWERPRLIGSAETRTRSSSTLPKPGGGKILPALAQSGASLRWTLWGIFICPSLTPSWCGSCLGKNSFVLSVKLHSLSLDGAVSSVQFTRSFPTPRDPMEWIQHARPPCPSPALGVYSNSCPLNQWCH